MSDHRRSSPPKRSGPFRRARILIVEDNHDLRDIYAAYLNHNGWHVELATNGQDACTRAAAFLPAIIIMDLVMPTLGGLEAMQTLKQDPRTAHIPVAVVTAYADREAEARTAGADAFIVKPGDPKALIAEIAKVLSAKGPARAKK